MHGVHENYAEPHMPPAPRVWDTRAVPGSEAFEFYRDGICSAFMPLRPERQADGSGPFRSKHVSHSIGQVALNIVSASPHPVFKGKPEISASEMECFYLNLQLAGRCRISQGDGGIALLPGHIALFDSARPFALDHGEEEPLKVISLMIPKSLVASDGQAAPRILSDHPVFGAALAKATAAFAQTARAAGGDALHRLRDVVLGLTDLVLNETLPAEGPGTRRAAHYFRLCDLVRRHCVKPEVSIGSIAAQVGLSIGTVRNIFSENNDAFGRRLRNERLDLAKQLLRRPDHAHLTVAEIGFRCGFAEAAHFGRVFKAQTGHAPGAWRRRSQIAPPRRA